VISALMTSSYLLLLLNLISVVLVLCTADAKFVVLMCVTV